MRVITLSTGIDNCSLSSGWRRARVYTFPALSAWASPTLQRAKTKISFSATKAFQVRTDPLVFVYSLINAPLLYHRCCKRANLRAYGYTYCINTLCV